MPWAKVTGIMQKANYGWSLVTIRKEIPHKRDKTESNQMRKKSPSTMAHPLGGGRGIRGRGYVRIGKNMIFIIVLLFGNNLQYEFNIWLQGVVIRTAPPTLSHTHTHARAHEVVYETTLWWVSSLEFWDIHLRNFLYLAHHFSLANMLEW